MTTFTSWDSELYHHGIKGQKWGIRRFQNPDGTLTAEGRAKYGNGKGEGYRVTSARELQKTFNRLEKEYADKAARSKRANYLGLKYSGKAIKKGLSPEGVLKIDGRLSKKLVKAAKAATDAERDMAQIQGLQYRIIAKAVNSGYTVNTRQARTIGRTGAAKVAEILAGPIGALTIGALTRGSMITKVEGHKIKIHK